MRRVELTSETRVRRSAATWTLVTLAAALTLLVTVTAVRAVLTAAGVVDADLGSVAGKEQSSLVGVLDEGGLRVAEGVAALAFVPLALALVALLAGLLRWREWAREGVLGVYGLGGLFLLVMSVNGLSQGGENAGLGLLASLAVLAVAALTFSPPVRSDFERVQIVRALRERAAARAAREQRATRG